MTLVVDWDGTVTMEDTQLMVLRRFGDPERLRRADEGLVSGRLTLHECIELEFSGLAVPLETVVEWLRESVRIRPGFHALVRDHAPLLLSSSFEELIRPILEREGLELDLLANNVEPRPDGWRPIWRDGARCSACSEACKRGSLPPGPITYVGDGHSDRCAALAADRVFARDGLARYLTERGVPFEPLTDFVALAHALDEVEE